MVPRKHATIYSDSTCIGNPGPGGYGVVLIYNEHRRELSGGYRRTTNNRMELMGPIKGLETLNQSCRVTLHGDSTVRGRRHRKGLGQAVRENSWNALYGGTGGQSDLWGRLLDLCESHEVEFDGSGDTRATLRNERCDQLAVQAASEKELPADEGYESPSLVQRRL